MLFKIALLWLCWGAVFLQRVISRSFLDYSAASLPLRSLNISFWLHISLVLFLEDWTRIRAFPYTSVFLLTILKCLAWSCSLYLICHTASLHPILIFLSLSPSFHIQFPPFSFELTEKKFCDLIQDLPRNSYIYCWVFSFLFLRQDLMFQAALKFTMQMTMALNFCWVSHSRCWDYRYAPPQCEAETLPGLRGTSPAHRYLFFDFFSINKLNILCYWHN